MPPQYPHPKFDTSLPWDFVPIEPQQPWPVTKKLYIFGFLIWPLWYVGTVYSIFGKDQATIIWGRRCIWNALILTAVITYIVVAYFQDSINSCELLACKYS
ncbi:3187_t:CDS:2 [Racocetra persica]|uniref:3187_t:CDS:1 n=1 Tax=Racocetra persica TaxID=160502 RepID=A0ACA9QQX1_9GLOM|nr:3187_t:CDS:2 [Racocetra persica]